jgi:hypothetical protein
MRKLSFLLVFTIGTFFSQVVIAQDAIGYQTPPQVIADLLLAKLIPAAGGVND